MVLQLVQLALLLQPSVLPSLLLLEQHLPHAWCLQLLLRQGLPVLPVSALLVQLVRPVLLLLWPQSPLWPLQVPVLLLWPPLLMPAVLVQWGQRGLFERAC